jgi:signal transduction histidine kinase
MHSARQALLRFVNDRTIMFVAIMFVVAVTLVLLHLHRMSSQLVRQTALENVGVYSEALAEFRTLYTSEVVSRAKKHGMKVTHDYEDYDDAIPLPATLSMKLGNRLGQRESGAQTYLYSDHPFPWRKDGRARDDFQRLALTQLREQPDRPVYRFEDFQGRPSLRYATADLMHKSCVSCHNTHADSPKTDWQVGDVRGMLEVVLPLENAQQQTQASFKGTFFLMVGLGAVGLLGLALVLKRLRTDADEKEAANQKLGQANTELQQQKNELTEVLQSLDEQNEQLAAAKQEADRRAGELESARRAALNMMEDANSARDNAELARVSLHDQAAELARKNAELAKEIRDRKQAQRDREQLHQRLMDSSRQAGMAEMATGVLHNVGNVLNSVNVSANLLVDRAKRSGVKGLVKATELMTDHSDRIDTFLTQDDRGKQLPNYLCKLTDVLVNEQNDLQSELDSLVTNIDHIKQIVNVQQSYARVSGVMESVDLAALIDDAMRVIGPSFNKREIVVRKDFEPLDRITTDKHKVLQILINLLSNAKHALQNHNGDEKILDIQLSVVSENAVCVQVRDTGTGIDPKNLTKIFQHGFTTKKRGHGFGLHSSAVAAQELGGSLTVHSAGRGQGATFKLTLPLKSAKRLVEDLGAELSIESDQSQ